MQEALKKLVFSKNLVQKHQTIPVQHKMLKLKAERLQLSNMRTLEEW
ncbi:hypothetical protein M674_04015 [Neisseria gonorrhoeae SK708]|nr:hypothetical protein M674_04015 [Neisseria gonorrhoeae SK708]